MTQRPCKVRRPGMRTRWCMSSSLDCSLCMGMDTTHIGTDTEGCDEHRHCYCCTKTRHTIVRMRFRTTLWERYALSSRVIASASDGNQRALRTVCVGSALHQRLVPPRGMRVRGRNLAASRAAHALVMMGTDRRPSSSTSLAVRLPELPSIILTDFACTVGYDPPTHQLVIGTDPLDPFEELAELLGHVTVTRTHAVWSLFLFYLRRVDTLDMAQVCAYGFFSILCLLLGVWRPPRPSSTTDNITLRTRQPPSYPL